MNFLDINGLEYFYNKIKGKFVKSVNSQIPDANGNVTIMIEETVNISAASTSQQIGSVTNSAINSNTSVIRAEIANPYAQTSDWTITTYDTAPQLRVTGTASDATTMTLVLVNT